MNRIEFLRSQIERAGRFAGSVTSDGERQMFQGMAGDYQREIDALSSADATGASAPSDAIAAKNEPDTAAPSREIAAPNGGDAITSTNDTGPQRDGLIALVACSAAVGRSLRLILSLMGLVPWKWCAAVG
jgi:hypothetical protein